MSETLGELADGLYAANQKIAEINQRLKTAEDEKRALEDRMLGMMDQAGTDMVRGKNATVSISETVRPQLQDFEAFSAFVLRRKALHLFERRISAAAYREIKDSLRGKAVPGVSEFTQRRLNIRKA